MGAPFVDWVHIFQRHNTLRAQGVEVLERPLPVVASGVRITDRWEEDVPVESFMGLAHEGSYSTKVWMRSDGSNVELSGNPGRWGRPDNVFNLDWPETIEACGKLLALRGLPAFTPGELLVKDSVSDHDRQLGLFTEWTGARVSEIHVTKNFETGSPQMAREVIRWWASQSKARLRKGRLGDETVVFGGRGSTHQIECYIKAPEMLANAKGEDAKRVVREGKVYGWANDVGLVRVEVKARRGFLRNRGMNYLGGVDMPNIVNLFNESTGFLLDAKPDQLARVVDHLPHKLRKYALLWLSGHDVAGAVARATFYRAARDLRGYGMDISEPRPLAEGARASAELDRILGSLPSFQLIESSPPEFYDAASEWGRAA